MVSKKVIVGYWILEICMKVDFFVVFGIFIWVFFDFDVKGVFVWVLKVGIYLMKFILEVYIGCFR